MVRAKDLRCCYAEGYGTVHWRYGLEFRVVDRCCAWCGGLPSADGGMVVLMVMPRMPSQAVGMQKQAEANDYGTF